jgi:hypothetical protein
VDIRRDIDVYTQYALKDKPKELRDMWWNTLGYSYKYVRCPIIMIADRQNKFHDLCDALLDSHGDWFNASIEVIFPVKYHNTVRQCIDLDDGSAMLLLMAHYMKKLHFFDPDHIGIEKVHPVALKHSISNPYETMPPTDDLIEIFEIQDRLNDQIKADAEAYRVSQIESDAAIAHSIAEEEELKRVQLQFDRAFTLLISQRTM